MDILTQVLQMYVGGQMEVQDGDMIRRGEIRGVAEEGDVIRIEFTWLAQADIPFTRWTKDDTLEFKLKLSRYGGFTNIGPSGGEVGGSDRLCFRNSSEMVVFYPPDGSKLDRSKVEGL